jgi:hypothetical protein
MCWNGIMRCDNLGGLRSEIEICLKRDLLHHSPVCSGLVANTIKAQNNSSQTKRDL